MRDCQDIVGKSSYEERGSSRKLRMTNEFDALDRSRSRNSKSNNRGNKSITMDTFQDGRESVRTSRSKVHSKFLQTPVK